ncbi:MAG: DUF1801 domain-containing protein [Bacteroidales bacterium]|nr:DUF1801 domain-containing protein [Bacteroidales bacterium]
MTEKATKVTDIESYIAGFPEHTQLKLQQIRNAIREAAPDAAETINYQMPTFQLHGNLVHFAGYKMHIGFYPAPSGIAAFETELTPWSYAKGSVQFPLNEPLPLELIQRIVSFRVRENLEKADRKSKKKASVKAI